RRRTAARTDRAGTRAWPGASRSRSRRNMERTLRAGIVGCGNISEAYLRLSRLFGGMEMRACADLDMGAAQARAAEFGVRADSVRALLGANDIDIVVNLTIPAAHHEV